MKLLFIEWEDSCQGRGWEPTENFVILVLCVAFL